MPGVHAEDLEVGELITVLRGPLDHTPEATIERQHMNGVPMQVLSRDYPYLAVAVPPGPLTNGAQRFIMDTRRVVLKRISAEYAHALGLQFPISIHTFAPEPEPSTQEIWTASKGWHRRPRRT